MDQIKAKFIGNIARDQIQPAAYFTISGSSSRGIFLTSEKDWVIFLSWEQFRGPMTINLTGNFQILHSLSQGDPALVDGDRLVFPRRGLSIKLSDASVWTPPPAPNPTMATDLRTIQTLLSAPGDEFLNAIAGLSNQTEHFASRIEALAFRIARGLQAGDSNDLSETAELLLGLGTGLTPEGDDFLIGICFSLERSGRMEDRQSVSREIVDAAYQRTTRLSANLIEAASNGFADERLVAAYDALYQGELTAPEAIQELLGWGNSSGRMALAGITAGMLTPT